MTTESVSNATVPQERPTPKAYPRKSGTPEKKPLGGDVRIKEAEA